MTSVKSLVVTSFEKMLDGPSSSGQAFVTRSISSFSERRTVTGLTNSPTWSIHVRHAKWHSVKKLVIFAASAMPPQKNQKMRSTTKNTQHK